jgi:hypothetical protein
MKSNFFILAILILPFKTVIAQTDLEAKAPTLQVGLDAFSFAKGSLDAQLIMEIVAEKQKELKVKAIQNVFLNKVQGAGGTVYTYVDNVVRELVFEPDQQVRTKKILENTVNLVFTMSYLNFYLASLEKDSKARQDIIELACIYNNDLVPIKNSLIKKNVINITDFSIEPRTISFFEDEHAVKFIALLIDMTSKAIREDRTLKQLGLMQVGYSETYEYLNLFNKLIHDKDSLEFKRIYFNVEPTRNEKKKLNQDQINLLTISTKLIKKNTVLLADSVYKDMRETLNSCTNFIGIVNYLVEDKTFRYNLDNLAKINYLDNKPVSFDTKRLKEINDSIKSLIKKLESEQPSALSKFSTIEGVNVLVQKQDSSLKADIQNLVKIYFYIDKAIKQIEATKSETDNITRLKTYADILYTFNSDFIPLLKNQSFRSFKYIDIIDSMNLFNNDFFTNIISTNEVLNKYKSEIPQFLLLVSKLYQFDRGSTISEYMKLLDDIGTTFPDDNVRNALSTVLKFVKDYSVIEKKDNNKEVLSFNVESFLYKLQTIKPYSNKRLSFLFTVGVNNAMFSKDLVLPDSSISRNLSFVGEKIGLKYTLHNWAFSRTRNPGETYRTSTWIVNTSTFIKTGPPKEPIVSNWHLLAYGSGILYNLVNTKTQKEFNMPIIGIGTGLTFYNGLDFNISWGVPIMANRPISSDNGFWNIGFDIQFIEYYDRLMEKRKSNQIQKRLVEAQKN